MADDVRSIIGLRDEMINEKIKFINNYKSSKNAATSSLLDPNANISQKNICTMQTELFKDFAVQINNKMMYYKIGEMFGYDLAEEYIDQLKNHEIYKHDNSSLSPYCVSITMYPFLLNGTKDLGGSSNAPEHFRSFCGAFISLVFEIASQFAGAVATTEFLMYADYFARKDYGDNYLETHKEEVLAGFDLIVYTLNEPAAARNYQAVFWNISIFDEPYFEALFGDFAFPDGVKPEYDSVHKLQEFFMNYFNKEREEKLLTFPVITQASLYHKDGEPYDYKFHDFVADQLAKGNSFFNYQSDSPDTLSSCCFSGNQMCLSKSSDGVNYMTFEELYEAPYNKTKRNFTIFHNGSWVKGEVVKIDREEKKLYRIVTSNNKELLLTEDHINVCIDDEKPTSKLTTDDFIAFNTRPLSTFPEKDEKLTYNQGFLIGAYLGDGSKYKVPTCESYEVIFSLSTTKGQVHSVLEKAINDWGIETNLYQYKSKRNVVFSKCCSKELFNIIKLFVSGNYSYEKRLNEDVLLQSEEFRRGIVDGWYATDGGNSNRIYTTSYGLVETGELLFTSLGLNTIINISDRTGEDKVEIRGEYFNRNYPLYTIRWYDMQNKRSMGDVYKVKNNTEYFKINSIAEISESEVDDYVYCFEMENKNEPYFTLPNGVITHNCRLANKIEDKPVFSYSLGAGGVATGSIGVITLNLNRLEQDNNRNLEDEILKIHKYHAAYRSLKEDDLNSGLLPAYKAGFITMDKQFSTIGFLGLVEAAEYRGIEISYNREFIDFCENKLKVIYDLNRKAKEKFGFLVNTEAIPGENVGVRFAKWDKEDGYESPRDCYNSYFYLPEDPTCLPMDKFKLHGKEVLQYLDGGSALHLNLDDFPTKDGYKDFLKYAAQCGCNYWCTNVPSTCCNDCGYIGKKKTDKCIKCGSKDVDYAVRVIGFLKKIKDFSEDRQKEASTRVYHEHK